MRLELDAVTFFQQVTCRLFGNKTPRGKISFFIRTDSGRSSRGVILTRDSFPGDGNSKNLLPLREKGREAKTDFFFFFEPRDK